MRAEPRQDLGSDPTPEESTPLVQGLQQVEVDGFQEQLMEMEARIRDPWTWAVMGPSWVGQALDALADLRSVLTRIESPSGAGATPKSGGGR